jgi:hypothetical protein
VAGDAELVLRVPDALLELPAVGRRLARLDAVELGLGIVELLLRAGVVDLPRSDRIVDERDRAVLALPRRGPRCLRDRQKLAQVRFTRCRERSRPQGRRSQLSTAAPPKPISFPSTSR